MAKAGAPNDDVLEYKCNTSVAPQLLETATVTINPGYEDATDHHHYQLLPHLLVVSEKNRTSSFWKAGSTVNSARIVSGVSLEPILDGPLAASNPHSTARTAIAVGGVVSVAISNNTKSDANEGRKLPILGSDKWVRKTKFGKQRYCFSMRSVPCSRKIIPILSEKL